MLTHSHHHCRYPTTFTVIWACRSIKFLKLGPLLPRQVGRLLYFLLQLVKDHGKRIIGEDTHGISRKVSRARASTPPADAPVTKRKLASLISTRVSARVRVASFQIVSEPDHIDVIHARSSGNPLMAMELIATLALASAKDEEERLSLAGDSASIKSKKTLKRSLSERNSRNAALLSQRQRGLTAITSRIERGASISVHGMKAQRGEALRILNSFFNVRDSVWTIKSVIKFMFKVHSTACT